MRRVPATQSAAWESIQSKLPLSRREVFHAIQDAGADGISTLGISQRLHWPINCVSGRITELRETGYVIDSGRRCVNPSGKKAIVWKAADVQMSLPLEAQ